MKETTVALKNRDGLHARPAGLFSKAASKYKSEIKVIKNGDGSKCCNPKSILSILSLGAKQGDQLTITVNGDDETEALKELQHLLEQEFDH
ncbi:MAG: HPr family phosphocarrier protein [Bacillota bacterium]